MAPLISVLIPARNCEAVIGPCLEAIKAQVLAPEEVIVINDASTDRTAEIVTERYSWARLISLPQNAGFTAAALEGYRISRGDWIAMLNADTEVHPAWLQEMMAAAQWDGKAGMIASRVLLADPAGTIDSLGIIVKRSGLAFLRGHGQADRPDEALPEVEEVFGPAGSAFLLKREMLDQTGFFEPDFFIYYDEVDLAFRCRLMGWKCLLANRSRVIHLHSYTYGRESAAKRYHLQRNRLRTLVRNWPTAWLATYFPMIVAYDLASIVLAWSEGNFRAPFKARWDFIKALPRDLEARRKNFLSMPTDAKALKQWLKREHLPVIMRSTQDREKPNE